MGDVMGGATAAAVSGSVDGFAGARELLERAQSDAQQARADAERYARLRQQEADLLVAKARRLLVAAEERAAVIIATARAQAADGTIDLTLVGDDDEIGRVVAPGASRLWRGEHPTRLDRMLAAAIAHAVDDAFPTEASA